MKWMLVVLVGGITPVNTNLVFEKFADCLAAEEQMRRHYVMRSRPGTEGLSSTSCGGESMPGHGICRPNGC